MKAFLLLLLVSFSLAAVNRIPHATGEIFVNGINVPWFENQFRHDIAPAAKHPDWGYWYNGQVVSNTFQKVKDLGFNVVRFWVCEGLEGLTLDNNGRVSGTSPTLWTNLDDVINKAAEKGLLIYLTILSAQVGDSDRVWSPLTDSAQHQAFLTHVFRPLATRYAGNNKIFAIDLMNEIQSDVAGNTGNWGGDGATWAQARTWMQETTAAIKAIDPTRLVTCSSGWHEPSVATVSNFQGLGFDFYDMHSYDNNVAFPDAGSIATDKPIIIGEYGPQPGGRNDGQQGTVNTAYLNKIRNGQFAGGFAWELGSVQNTGNNGGSIWAFLNENGGSRSWVPSFTALLTSGAPTRVTVSGNAPPPTTGGSPPPTTGGSPSGGCVTDNPPDNSYTCAQQASWGKCGESWMAGYCLKSCPAAGTDIPPDSSYTCAQQASWGKCGESWMVAAGKCLVSCAPTCSGSTPPPPPPPTPGAPPPPPPPPPPTTGGSPSGCVTDIPPAGNSYTCTQQRDWGKCGESWMQGYCLKSCPAAGTDIPPDNSYTCAQQAGWGKCGESWMVAAGKCLVSCAPTCNGNRLSGEEDEQTVGLSAGAIAGIAIGAAAAAIIVVAAGVAVYFYSNKEGTEAV